MNLEVKSLFKAIYTDVILALHVIIYSTFRVPNVKVLHSINTG